MNITTISYSRLVSLGNYENEKVGATAEVEPGEDPNTVLSDLKAWVATQIKDRQEDQEVSSQLADKQYKLVDLERRIENAKAKYAKLREILSSHGVTLETLPDFNDLPF